MVEVNPLLTPKEIELLDRKGKPHKYILSEIPASYSKEIVLQYPTSALPKIGNYELHQEITFKMLSYVAVPMPNGVALRLTTRELLDNHIPDLQTWMALEKAMAQYNWGFFLGDDLSNFWEQVKKFLVQSIQQTWTDLSQPLSQTEKQP